MHAHAEIWLRNLGEVEEQIQQALSPFDQNSSSDGFWDWWSIGGRFSGEHTDYDPYNDERNFP